MPWRPCNFTSSVVLPASTPARAGCPRCRASPLPSVSNERRVSMIHAAKSCRRALPLPVETLQNPYTAVHPNECARHVKGARTRPVGMEAARYRDCRWRVPTCAACRAMQVSRVIRQRRKEASRAAASGPGWSLPAGCRTDTRAGTSVIWVMTENLSEACGQADKCCTRWRSGSLPQSTHRIVHRRWAPCLAVRGQSRLIAETQVSLRFSVREDTPEKAACQTKDFTYWGATFRVTNLHNNAPHLTDPATT